MVQITAALADNETKRGRIRFCEKYLGFGNSMRLSVSEDERTFQKTTARSPEVSSSSHSRQCRVEHDRSARFVAWLTTTRGMGRRPRSPHSDAECKIIAPLCELRHFLMLHDPPNRNGFFGWTLCSQQFLSDSNGGSTATVAGGLSSQRLEPTRENRRGLDAVLRMALAPQRLFDALHGGNKVLHQT